MNQTQRLFIAVNLPPHLQALVLTKIKILKASVSNHKDIRWVTPESLHITLKFLGNTEYAYINDIKDSIKTVAGANIRFSVMLNQVGMFASRGKPRVIWIGLKDQAKQLRKLHHELDETLAKLGFKPENRDFKPHLTIGRVRDSLSNHGQHEITNLVRVNKTIIENEQWDCDTIALMKSDLKPQGPVYTPLFRANLS